MTSGNPTFPPRDALALPEKVDPRDIMWGYVGGIIGYHLLAILACFPWFFSWTGVALVPLGIYAFGTLGINLCYHRILTHQGLVVPKWLERTFALLGVCCLQDSPVRWVIIHRLHHQYSDERPDPHSPLVTFLWAHVGWLFLKNHQVDSAAGYDKYGRDILKDPFYRFLERHHMWVWINGLQALLFVAGGALGGYWWTGTTAGAIQQAASVFVWGVIVRTVVVWHITWSVNSLTHVWGYKNYPTDDNSRNNWLVGWVAMGEGWHNNHHADQRSAAHGHKWWEFDATWWTVRALEIVGLAKEVVRPRLPA